MKVREKGLTGCCGHYRIIQGDINVILVRNEWDWALERAIEGEKEYMHAGRSVMLS